MDLGQLSDEALLVRSREEATAFGAFYRRHVGAVHSYFRRRVPDVEVAYDLTAETFAAALQAVPRYEPGPAPARAWLFAIARNTLFDSLRRGQVEDRARIALAMQPIALDDDDVEILRLVAETPALEAADELPADQREAVLGRHLTGESYEDLAARLSCSESVVRQRVSRGLSYLRAKLEGTR